MDDELAQQIATVVLAYGSEAQWWETVPGPCKASRDRLKRFVELEAPVSFIESEIALLYRKIKLMREARLHRLH